MNTVTQFLAGLTNAHYILLYLCCFALAVLCVLIETKTKLKAISVLLPVFSLNGGMLAIAFVTIKLDLNIGLGILVVWAVFSSIIIFPSLWIHKRSVKKEVPEKPASIICSENGHQWEKTEIACTVRCARCGKTKVRHQFEILPDKHEKRCVFCGHTEAVPYKQRIIRTGTTESKPIWVKWGAIAACLCLMIPLTAFAVDIIQYNAAVDYLNSLGIAVEDLSDYSHKEIKEAAKTIDAGESNPLTEEILSLIPENKKPLDTPTQVTSEQIKELTPTMTREDVLSLLGDTQDVGSGIYI